MSALLSLAVRTLHVLAVTVLVGGSAATWYGYRINAVTGLVAATRFEWLFWTAVVVLVLTGVGNLGALGPPGPSTDWGRVFSLKLVLVLCLVGGSAVRTMVVVRARKAASVESDTGTDARSVTGPASPAPFRRLLSNAYGATTGLLLGIVVLAEVLAHG
ncbi:MAG: CopD family protein [Haloarcula sp.]